MKSSFAALLLMGASSGAFAQTPDPRALFAAERLATGGDVWNSVAAIRSSGTLLVGEARSPVEQLTDHRNGFTWRRLVAGGVTDVSGFNGNAWDATGGLVAVIDLPGLQADAVTQAYLSRDGWWNPGDAARMKWLKAEATGTAVADVVEVTPRGGSPIDVWIDRSSHLVAKTVQETDTGPLVTTYADWHAVGGVRLPFEQVSTDATGATTKLKIGSASLDPSVDPTAFAPPRREQRGSVANVGVAKVPFQLDAFNRGHIIVEGRVDSKPATLIFDTGGANYFVPEAAKRLDLKPAGGLTIAGIGEGSLTGGFAAVREIALGDARLTDQSAIVAPLPYPAVHPRAGINVDGLVGAEFFWALRTEVDYLHRTLRFSDPRTPGSVEGSVLPFFTDGHIAYVEATVDGATGLFGIDTGDPGALTVFRKFADAHHIFQGSGVKSLVGGGVGGHASETTYPAHSFSIGRVALPAPKVDVTDLKAGGFASKTIAGNIGAAVLSHFTMTFDPLKHTLTLAPNSMVNTPYPVDRAGISATQEGPNDLKVLSVKPASAAEAAGLRAGDSIVAIDGLSVPQNHLGLYNLSPFAYGTKSFTLTVERAGQKRVITIVPKAPG